MATAATPDWAEPFNFSHPIVSSDPNLRLPPLDGSLSPPALLDFYAENNPSYTYLKWLDSQGDLQTINWKETAKIVHTFAHKIATELSHVSDTYSKVANAILATTSRPVIGLVANVDAQSYILANIAAVRAGFVPFAISINNSAEALEHLLRTSHAQALFVAPRGSSPEVDQALDIALQKFGRSLPTMTIPALAELRTAAAASQLPPPPILVTSLEETHHLLHSSGSTSFPKVIPYKHKHLISVVRSYWYSPTTPPGNVVFIGHLPPWHAMGMIQGVGYALCGGVEIAMRAPIVPPPPVQLGSLLTEVSEVGANMFASVPAMFEAWAQSPEAVKQLRAIKSLGYGGGPLPAHVGRSLFEQGVRLQCVLGSTEGQMIALWPDNVADPFYFHLHPQIPAIFREFPDTAETGEYELLLGVSGRYSPTVINETYMEKPVFATNDIIAFHPTDKTLVRVVGRLDDQIMHSSGEKTNPGPILAILCKSPYIRSALYFGRERPHVGAIIDPAPGHEVPVGDDKALAAFRNKIASAIDEANAFAPTHSALYKEMVIVSQPAKPFERTAKGSLRSGAILKAYADEIDAAYDAFEQTGQTATKVPASWDAESARAYVRAVVSEALERSISPSDDADLFSNGANSLSATKIRSVLSAALTQASKTAPRLTPDFVYAHPTIQNLASAFLLLIEGKSLADGEGGAADHLKAMEAMLAKYTSDWPARPTAKPATNGVNGHGHASEVALVTGTTGGLGAHLLADLVADPSVRKVFAVNRRSATSTLLQRQREALEGRGLDASLASHDKVVLVVADLERDDLGVQDSHLLEAMKNETTFIVHNSWRLDFNLSLASFESHVASTRHLVDLALRSPLSSPPPLLFTSSIGVTRGWNAATQGKVPEAPLDLAISVGGGYGESKAVTEKMLLAATEKTGIKTCSIRIGQMSGSTTNGAWAPTDWLPLIVRAAPQLRQLPSCGAAPITWLPTDVASQAVLSFRHDPPPVLHIVHPHPVSWDTVMVPIAETLGAKLVPFEEWVRTLEKKAGVGGGEEQLPALRLLSFYKSVASSNQGKQIHDGDTADVEAMGFSILSTTEATRLSEDLRNAAPLEASDAQRWLTYWKTLKAL